ncbi:hypothetical protein HDU93_008472 [Gonapodya sp. JEL0774]|nr:hypothetical protein HDU93_008472 [Gonapodya sp. JEL0774]
MESVFTSESAFLSLLRSGALETPDDVVWYSVILEPPTAQQSRDAYEESLRHILCDVIAWAAPLVAEYPWNADSFALHVQDSAHDSSTHSAHHSALPYPFLHGHSRLAHALEDLWFIVFLLYQISKRVHGAVVIISDSDGPPDLIHAARHLPPFLDPSTATNRCFVFAGDPHIIPLSLPRPSSTPNDDYDPSPTSTTTTTTTKTKTKASNNPPTPTKPPLTLALALSLVRSPHHPTLAPPRVISSIHRKLSTYPLAALPSSTRHRFVARLTPAAAAVVAAEPELVGEALRRFLERTAEETRRAGGAEVERAYATLLAQGRGATSTTTTTTTTTDPTSWLRVSCSVSKRVYARARAHTFYPPRMYRRVAAVGDGGGGGVGGDAGGGGKDRDREREKVEWDMGVKLVRVPVPPVRSTLVPSLVRWFVSPHPLTARPARSRSSSKHRLRPPHQQPSRLRPSRRTISKPTPCGTRWWERSRRGEGIWWVAGVVG